MEAKLLSACAGRLHLLQAIHVTFVTGSGGIAGLRRLLNLIRSSPKVRIELSQLIALQFVAESGRWEHVSRTVMVYGIMHADADLLEPMARDVESVHAGQHFASRLFVSSERKQHAAATDILLAVLNQSTLDQVEEYSARIDGKLCLIDGIPAITFTIFNKETNEKLVELSIDGFSGRYAIDGKWGDQRFSDAQGVRERIYSVLTDRLDMLTAA